MIFSVPKTKVADAGLQQFIDAVYASFQNLAKFKDLEERLNDAGTIENVPAGTVVAFAGSTTPSGWLVCDGGELAIADYKDLYDAIGTTWNTCRNQSTGASYSAPAAGNFRKPDLRGVFLRGVGTAAGHGSASLAGPQDDATARNGIVLSGSAPALTGTTSFASTGHTHNARGSLTAHIEIAATSSPAIFEERVAAAESWGRGLQGNASGQGSSGTGTQGAKVSGNTAGPSSTASVGISGGSYSLGAGDAETRPVNVGVNYIIKI